MRIEQVTPDTTDERVKQWHAAEVAAAGEQWGWPLPPMSLQELRAHADHPGAPPIARYEATLAIDDDDVVGFTHSWWMTNENAHLLDVSVHVLPERRREGIGRRLLAERVEAARADARRSLTLPAPEGSPAESFAVSVGAERGIVERHSVLELADVDWELVDRSAPPTAGYRIESWTGLAPEDLLPSLARAVESMDDAPKGTLDIAFATWTDDMVRASHALSSARGYRRLVVAAVHEASGEVAGFTEIQIAPGRDEYAEQNDTVVVPAHRGRRLGMSMKATMLQRLRVEEPTVRTISTWNAEENRWMLAVNVALGFRKAEPWGMYQLTLG
jgi:GNAT superfamily N-acetyltransferase